MSTKEALSGGHFRNSGCHVTKLQHAFSGIRNSFAFTRRQKGMRPGNIHKSIRLAAPFVCDSKVCRSSVRGKT